MQPNLSVVIVNYLTREYVLNCLASIQANLCGLDVEIIVIDNASGDGCIDEVARRFPFVRTVANGENRFFSGGYSQGIELATGTHVLALNPDTLVRGQTLPQMLDALQAGPALGAITTMLYFPDGTLQ